MQSWIRLARATITRPEELARVLEVDLEEVRRVHQVFPLRVNPYYLGLIRERGDPIWRQAIPDSRELVTSGAADPLAEDRDSPVESITHRYPDRALLYVNHICPVYCRFCTRRRKVGDPRSTGANAVRLGIEYIRQHPELRDVIVSGGDPLMMADRRIDRILRGLRAIPHVEIIRLGTRVPVTLPQRITQDLCGMLRKHHPLYINTHFNHPREVTPEATRACSMLADAGIPLGNQTVLLKGVNDSPAVMKELVQQLLTLRVKPYYMYQADLVAGSAHFRTPLQTGLDIIQALRGHTSGMAVPHFVIDAPGGGGKIAIAPNPIVALDDNEVLLRNYEGRIFSYPSTVCQLPAKAT
ncbi:MAG: KamA family radical SAM protein [Gemmatimonadales bacterium]|nr:KamA family radical SAM protein [Gemmatimonadales bacterium]NIN10235.1 KamA family radical SAM protein [Gemmatimonadales bacterium]NIN49032.1 KamA family radical SAM protein [Gemmatimonadales bacterium]NIP06496.1 KamA family radical SAM protein [Gemmatimonadales bacterium]NIR02717.1 KamA family radical SAM protein [Gemmatimonadales bacterium]